MADEHPNITLLQRIDLRDLASAKDVIAEDFVWHYFNPRLPEMEGDYVGLEGLASFFEKIRSKAGGAFGVEPVSITAAGDALVVTHSRNSMTLDGRDLVFDAVVVWRFADGRIAEAWDIPAADAARVVSRQ